MEYIEALIVTQPPCLPSTCKTFIGCVAVTGDGLYLVPVTARWMLRLWQQPRPHVALAEPWRKWTLEHPTLLGAFRDPCTCSGASAPCFRSGSLTFDAAHYTIYKTHMKSWVRGKVGRQALPIVRHCRH